MESSKKNSIWVNDFFNKGVKIITQRKTVFSTNGTEKNYILKFKRMKLDIYHIPYIKINSNSSRNLKVKAKAIKLLK